MNRGEMIQAYAQLSDAHRRSFLARLAFELTVQARGTYAAGSEDVNDPRRLRAFNELQHQVTQHLCHLLEGDAARYPEDHFGPMLYEAATDLGIIPKLSRLLANAGEIAVPKARAKAGRVA